MYASTFTGCLGRAKVSRAAVVGDGRVSKAEQVLGLLTEDIVAGRLPPGEKLVEEEIAARLHCSRTPVREALRHLDAIGLVSFRPRHGATVAGLSSRVMRDMLDALVELESLCAELAARRIDPPHREALARTMEAGGTEEEVLAFLHAVSGNPVLVEMVELLRTRLGPYLRKADGERSAAVSETLAAVVREVLGGDAAGARTAMQVHVGSAQPPQLP